MLGVSQKRATQLTERGKLPYIDGPNGRLILWEVVLERKRWRDEAKAAAGEAVSDDS